MWLLGGTVALTLVATSLAPLVNAFQSALNPCPVSCDASLQNWTVYSSADRLQHCDKPMLLEFMLYPELGAPEKNTNLKACIASNMSSELVPSAVSKVRRFGAHDHHAVSHGRLHHRDKPQACNAGEKKLISLDFIAGTSTGSVSTDDLHTILVHLESRLKETALCEATTIFGYYRGAAIGLYIGVAVDNIKTISPLIQRVLEQLSDDQRPKNSIMQRCDDVSNADWIIGVAIDATGDLASAQSSVHSWSNGKCATIPGTHEIVHKVAVVEEPLSATLTNTTAHPDKVSKRSDCKTTSVSFKDGCPELASKCGISASDFTKYNTDKNLCSSLTPGQHVCCSSGSLPDFRPKANSDGSCHSYKVQSGDTCAPLAAANGLTQAEINNFNDGTTWGWYGCDDLQLGSLICLSAGDPPMPATVSGAECGPIKPGTKRPTNGTALADLNQCPLNSCCDKWGQCGITPEFCTNSTGPTGNPGTAPAGKNGCISNCGTKIVKSGVAPVEFWNVGYYESWNYDRPCLNLRVADVDVMEYTHVHWGFAGVSDDFNVTINDTYHQWEDFTNLLVAKKILSFGGWGESTSPSTYNQLRDAMHPANVDTFVQNIFDFIMNNNLNGVDFDWEYPGVSSLISSFHCKR